MTFFGLKPTNPNQLTLTLALFHMHLAESDITTPPPRIPRSTPPLPPLRSVDPHISLTTKSLPFLH